MLRPIRFVLSFAGSAAVLATSATANAQFFSPAGSCGCAQPARAMSVSYQSCAPAPRPVAIPITQTCVQQVPVTEYQQVRQKVRRPVTEVEYVEQPVTTYRPVVETREVDVPVTEYQNVTEMQTVTSNNGYWKTNYQCRQKIAPCAYDSRPGVAGWFNRTAFSVRQSLTPSVVASREYVPQVCTSQVPVTRQVAINSTRRQTYQVTRYVPEQSTRRVAVNKVRWVEDEVIAMKPVTVMKSVPTTRTAWTYGTSYGGTTVAYGPTSTIAWGSTPTIAVQPTPDTERSARKPDSTRTAIDEPKDAGDDRHELDRIEGAQRIDTGKGLGSLAPTGLNAVVQTAATDEIVPVDVYVASIDVGPVTLPGLNAPAGIEHTTARHPEISLPQPVAPAVQKQTAGPAPSMFEPVRPGSRSIIGMARASGWQTTAEPAAEKAPILLPVGMPLADASR